MSNQSDGVDITRIAAADLSAAQFHFVKVNAQGQIVLAAAGEPAIGVVQNNPALGIAATVRVAGVTKIKAAAVIAAGADVASNATGRAVTATGGRTNTSDAGAAADALQGSNVMGVALESAASGDVISLLLQPRGAVPTNAI